MQGRGLVELWRSGFDQACIAAGRGGVFCARVWGLELEVYYYY